MNNKGQFKLKWTEKKIINYIKETGYHFVEFLEFNGTKSRIVVKCNNGHKPYDVNFNKFLHNRRCKECFIERKRKWSKEEIKKYIEDNDYLFIDFIEFSYKASRVSVQCKNGHESYEVSFSHFYNGSRCPYCTNHIKYTYKYVKEYIESFDYKLVSDKYENAKSKLNVECPKGHKYYPTFNHFLEGRRCSQCNENVNKSKGETVIKEFLLINKINYNREYIFNDCMFKGKLRFDFYIPDFNTIIEYDGRQHYEIIDFKGLGYEYALNDFIDCKIRDTIKDLYCKNNNINLIRIPYWEFKNIENILIENLQIFNKNKLQRLSSPEE